MKGAEWFPKWQRALVNVFFFFFLFRDTKILFWKVKIKLIFKAWECLEGKLVLFMSMSQVEWILLLTESLFSVPRGTLTWPGHRKNVCMCSYWCQWVPRSSLNSLLGCDRGKGAASETDSLPDTCTCLKKTPCAQRRSSSSGRVKNEDPGHLSFLAAPILGKIKQGDKTDPVSSPLHQTRLFVVSKEKSKYHKSCG